MKRRHRRRTSTISLLVSALAGLLILSGCAGQEDQQPCEETAASFSYYNSDTFDTRFTRLLSCGTQEVSVTLPEPATTGNIPARLDRWLGAVDRYEGDVRVVADGQTDDGMESKDLFLVGFVFDVLDFARSAYNEIKKTSLYRPAKEYNATLYYEKGSGTITRVVFSRKAEEGEK